MKPGTKLLAGRPALERPYLSPSRPTLHAVCPESPAVAGCRSLRQGGYATTLEPSDRIEQSSYLLAASPKSQEAVSANYRYTDKESPRKKKRLEKVDQQLDSQGTVVGSQAVLDPSPASRQSAWHRIRSAKRAALLCCLQDPVKRQHADRVGGKSDYRGRSSERATSG